MEEPLWIGGRIARRIEHIVVPADGLTAAAVLVGALPETPTRVAARRGTASRVRRPYFRERRA
ncbi:hypothetical protein GCM10010170_030230 [Dactylosporangium salmoneum]|uniref:Uncharacterized protein n=1 Tax=Dactylosporangium salmoneum TaxID=53361 RepID=A0ABN3G5H4_9ACTN